MSCCRGCRKAASASGRRSPPACRSNPQSVRAIVTLMAFYLHVGPYSRYVMKQIDRQIDDLEQGRFVAPKLLPAVAPEPVAVNA